MPPNQTKHKILKSYKRIRDASADLSSLMDLFVKNGLEEDVGRKILLSKHEEEDKAGVFKYDIVDSGLTKEEGELVRGFFGR
jgi:hypothetical protein